MNKSRKSILVAQYEISTQAELQMAVAAIARDMLVERETKNAMDSELQAVRAKYATGLSELCAAIDERTVLISDYCQRHEAELFPKDRRSVELPHATIGFRTSPPSCKLRKGWTWAAVLEAIKARDWKEFVRVKEDVDKDRVIAARETHPLDKIGVEIAQAETFFIAPKDLSEQPIGVAAEARPASLLIELPTAPHSEAAR